MDFSWKQPVWVYPVVFGGVIALYVLFAYCKHFSRSSPVTEQHEMPVLGRLVGGVGGRTVVEDEERPVGGGDGEGDEGEEREEVEAGEEGEEEGDIGLFRMPLAM